MRPYSLVIRFLGGVLFCLALPALLAWSAEPAKKAPQVDPAVQDLVQAALENEAAGDNARRDQGLQEALKKSPEDAATHWQLGQVWIDSRWMTPDQAQQAASKDKRLAEYRKLRDRSVLTVDSQAALARWCRKNKLADEERAHWQTVLQLQPDNAEAIKALGLRPFAGTLLTQAQIQRVKSQLQTWAKAVDRWRPLVVQWRNAVKHHQTAPPAELRDKLVKLSDSAEMLALERALWQEVGAKREKEAYHAMLLAMIEMLAGNPRPAAAGSLARLAVFCDLKDVHAAAIEALKKHPLDHYAPLLLSGLQMPIEAQAQPLAGRGGFLVWRNSLFQEGAMVNQSSSTTFQLLFQLDSGEVVEDYPTWLLGPGRLGSMMYALVVPMLSQQVTAREAAYQEAVRRANKAIAQQNVRIEAVLSQTTDLDMGDDPMKWWTWWWQDYNESYNVSGGTDHTTDYPPPKPEYHADSTVPVIVHCSCFAPGTKVWTLTGRQAIETVKVGDRVLAQDADSGELAYKPVLGVTVREPTSRMKIRAGSDTITATPSHPFWVAGQGWRMTKQLEVGSRLHTLSGSAPVETIEKLPIDPSYNGMAYNLIVADFDSYFVGDEGILVHDNTPRQPTAAVLPGLKK